MHIPQYIDNVSLLKIEMWQTRSGSEEEQVYKELQLTTPDQGSGSRTIRLTESLLDQVNGRVRAVITLDIYGTGEVVLPLPEPSWSKEDEARRQGMLTEQRITPVGIVSVAGSSEQEVTEKVETPILDETKPIELTAGPPPAGEPEDYYMLAP